MENHSFLPFPNLFSGFYEDIETHCNPRWGCFLCWLRNSQENVKATRDQATRDQATWDLASLESSPMVTGRRRGLGAGYALLLSNSSYDWPEAHAQGGGSKSPNSGGTARPFWIVRVSGTLREQFRSRRFGGSQPRGSRPSVRLEPGSVPGGSGGGGKMSAEAADREAATSSRPCTPPQTCWFEFLLEESLLEKHLRKPCPGKRGARGERDPARGAARRAHNDPAPSWWRSCGPGRSRWLERSSGRTPSLRIKRPGGRGPKKSAGLTLSPPPLCHFTVWDFNTCEVVLWHCLGWGGWLEPSSLLNPAVINLKTKSAVTELILTLISYILGFYLTVLFFNEGILLTQWYISSLGCKIKWENLWEQEMLYNC